ncbi:hypothetical protein WA171_002219 [Blastocystis sp. BT1]
MILPFILLLSVAFAAAENRESWSQQRIDNYYQKLYDECETVTCKEFNRYENMNCIHECICKQCYTKIYEREPLEPGEVDFQREDDFIVCTKNSIRNDLI